MWARGSPSSPPCGPRHPENCLGLAPSPQSLQLIERDIGTLQSNLCSIPMILNNWLSSSRLLIIIQILINIKYSTDWSLAVVNWDRNDIAINAKKQLLFLDRLSPNIKQRILSTYSNLGRWIPKILLFGTAQSIRENKKKTFWLSLRFISEN